MKGKHKMDRPPPAQAAVELSRELVEHIVSSPKWDVASNGDALDALSLTVGFLLNTLIKERPEEAVELLEIATKDVAQVASYAALVTLQGSTDTEQ